MIRLERPLICLVTDRRRLPGGSEEALVRLVAGAVAAGVNLVHLRERDLDDRRLLGLARRIVEIAGTRAAVVVNDRVDVALASGAAGVHLRADSPAAERVRAVVPGGFLIGRSVHRAGEAAAAAASGVDYLVAGTVYPSASKAPGSAVLGVEQFAAIVREAAVPVLAIGGITADKVGEVAAAGAAGVAAIGLFAGEAADAGAGPPAVVAAIRRAFVAGDGGER